MGQERESIDWLRITIHFVVGAVVGGVLGLFTALGVGANISWLWIGIPALIIGTLAAIYGDSFWNEFGEMVFWFWWWW